MNEYRFYITHDSTVTEVFPLYDFLRFSWRKDDFRYTKKCNNQFTFANIPAQSIADFDLFYGIETGLLRCEKIEFEIQRSCDKGASYSSYWIGEFAVNDGEFNLDNCVYAVNIEAKDRYTCLKQNEKQKVNILDVGPLLTIDSKHQDFESIELYDFYDDVAPAPANSTLCYHWNALSIDIYGRERATTNNLSGENVPPSNDPAWAFVSSAPGVSTWDRPLILGSIVFTSNLIPGPTANEGSVRFTTGPHSPFPDHYPYIAGTNHSGLHPSAVVWMSLPFTYIPTNTFTQFHKVEDSILYILQEICPDVQGIRSDFFEWNPVGDAPGYVPGFNYVTGDPNVITNLAQAQKSDVILPAPSQYATLGEISFESLMENMDDIFNTGWFVDDDNYLRIEHIKYFQLTLGFDSTSSPHKKFNIKNNAYSYKKLDMPSREIFTFIEAQGTDFVGKDIIYDSACVETNINNASSAEKTYSVNEFTTDMNYIDNYPDRIDKNGFVMVVYVPGTPNTVHAEVGKLSGILVNNGHLSWANLHHNYHRYGRVLLEGSMNGVVQPFFTENRNKVQKEVKLEICCGVEFDPTGILIQTGLGQGEVEIATLKNNIVNMTINI